MGKLTRAELAAHRQAVAMLEEPGALDLDRIAAIFERYHEGAESDQTGASAYFTPCGLASDLQLDTPSGGSLVDLCAGIGRLAYFASGRWRYEPDSFARIVCVEINPRYCEVGRRLFPEAEWICGDALDPAIIRQIGNVDFAISNPPFGRATKSEHKAPRYKGADFDLAVMDVAAAIAPECWAIVPADRAPWDAQGRTRESRAAEQFQKATGLGLHRFSSVDCSYYRNEWRGVAPAVEIVGFGVEFENERRDGLPLTMPSLSRLLEAA